MFSGIVEATSPIEKTEAMNHATRIFMRKPREFNDMKIGDSIAVDGVCLTLETQSSEEMSFTVAAETLKVLRWNHQSWQGRVMNLERSLRFGDRIHGHLVTGHVDSLGEVTTSQALGDSWILRVKIDGSLLALVWKKGSITLNGVSLTVNEIEKTTEGAAVVEVCLIPETLKRTNLGLLTPGNWINVEPDYMAKAMLRAIETGYVNKPSEEKNGFYRR